NADDLFDRADEDLAVADLARMGGLDDRLHGLLDHVVTQHHLDLDLGQEIHDIFGTAIELGVALLPPETLHLGDGQAGDADFGQAFAHLVQLERLDDRLDLLHPRLSCISELILVAGCYRITPVPAEATRRHPDT